MFEKKSKPICYEWDKMQVKTSDVEAKAQGEDIKRATSCCLMRNETTKQRFTSFCASRVELN